MNLIVPHPMARVEPNPTAAAAPERVEAQRRTPRSLLGLVNPERFFPPHPRSKQLEIGGVLRRLMLRVDMREVPREGAAAEPRAQRAPLRHLAKVRLGAEENILLVRIEPHGGGAEPVSLLVAHGLVAHGGIGGSIGWRGGERLVGERRLLAEDVPDA